MKQMRHLFLLDLLIGGALDVGAPKRIVREAIAMMGTFLPQKEVAVISKTTAISFAALVGALVWTATVRADQYDRDTYWANHTGTTLSVGQSIYVVPPVAQPAPQEQPEGPAIEAAYREGPQTETPEGTQAVPSPAGTHLYRFGNGSILLPN
jgi:hypothetical protein